MLGNNIEEEMINFICVQYIYLYCAFFLAELEVFLGRTISKDTFIDLVAFWRELISSSYDIVIIATWRELISSSYVLCYARVGCSGVCVCLCMDVIL